MINKQAHDNIFINSLTDENNAEIEKMINKKKSNNAMELEVSFKKISYPNYIRIVEHYVNKTAEENISAINSLDINISLSNNSNYRVSLMNGTLIDDFINKHSRSSVQEIQKYILNLDKSDDIEFMFKNRDLESKLYVDDFNMNIKLAEENITNDKPTFTGTERILYRYKQRVSFILDDFFRLDVTDVQESNKLWNLANNSHVYEIELEVIKKDITLKNFLEKIIDILKVIQSSDIPIGKKESQEVIKAYMGILNISSQITSPVERKVISIESQHIVNFIPNKYCVTDKADGDRYFVVSLPNGIYLISLNLNVKKTMFITSKKEYINMILDGEMIKNSNEQYALLIFDVVFANGIDYRYDKNLNLKTRINIINDIVDNCFKNLINFPDYSEKHKNMDLDKIKKFYSDELKTYWKTFNDKLLKSSELFISRKLYFVPYGINPCEIFMYADMIWKLYVYDVLTPYKLDGIIYTPLNSSYLISNQPHELDTTPQDYKWKPPHLNSFDFYIQFEKNKTTNTDALYFDDSIKEGGSQYKICKLYAHTYKGKEIPIPFMVDKVEQRANIYVSDNEEGNNEVRDIEGKIIEDNTVVEFSYDTLKNDVVSGFKWIPLRTRYDKTESVLKYGTKHGNHISTALRIWKTILNPITEESISALGNPNTYEIEMKKISELSSNTKQVYYQKKSKMVPGMTAFHNWIKTNMISTYAYEKPSLLDIGAGRGGDLLKIIYAKVGLYVGLDVDYHGLFIDKESAFKRYANFKKTIPNLPPMHFINANAKGLFNLKAQKNIIPTMNNINEGLINKYLSGNKKYSVINCQFSMHYYLSDEVSWSNFLQNINDHLEDGGYMMITCFDGKIIREKLKGNKSFTITQTDNNGANIPFCDIVKMYSDEDPIGLGLGIDVYNATVNTKGQYFTEYLVDPDFLQKEFKNKCNMQLVESDLFYNIFNLYKKYFTIQMTSEDYDYLVGDNVKNHEKIVKYYQSLDPNKKSHFLTEEIDLNLAAFKMSSLNRYYIFRKSTKILNLSEPSRIVGINNKFELGKVMIPYFSSNNVYIDPISKNNINDLYKNIITKREKPSVYLIRHTIISMENDTIRQNKFELVKVKEGTIPQILLIYKSPEKRFHHVFHVNKGNNIPYFKSEKIIEDLNFLMELNNKF